MSLVLPSDNEVTPINENTMGHGHSNGGGINGKGKRLERSKSFVYDDQIFVFVVACQRVNSNVKNFSVVFLPWPW